MLFDETFARKPERHRSRPAAVDNFPLSIAQKISIARGPFEALRSLTLRAVGAKLSTWHSRHD